MRFQATLLVFLGGFKIVLVVVELLTHLLYLPLMAKLNAISQLNIMFQGLYSLILFFFIIVVLQVCKVVKNGTLQALTI